MKFGQLVIGPPGSGKTTYCNAMKEFLTGIGRKVAIVNIDPANDTLPYSPSIDISDLITLDDVMDSLKLGPNGGLIYSMEFLETNIEWLLEKLNKLENECYLLIDCPGQVELYTHHNSVKNVVDQMIKKDFRLTAVHLVDSHYCSDPGKFIAVVLTSLCTMLQVELPHINILSKVDIAEKYGKLLFNLDFYSEVMDLTYLLDQLEEDPFLSKYKKLNEAFTGIIGDYSLVSFLPLNIENKQSMKVVLEACDKANGYIFGQPEERNIQNLLSVAMKADIEGATLSDLSERLYSSETTVVQEEGDEDPCEN